MNKEGWTYKIFTDCMEKIPHPKQVKTDEYHPIGRYPVVSQEEKTIAGYSDLTEYVYQPPKPIIIFGDHTRVLKYVDFDFIVGADGVKILIPKDDLQTKFLYYYLKWYKIPNLGYSRHFKLLKEINVPVPPLSIQQRIVSELDQLSDIIAMKRKQVEEYDALTQSVFYEMFGSEQNDYKNYPIFKLSEISEIGTGSTPSRKQEAFYFNGTINWVKTTEVHGNLISETEEKITRRALEETNCKVFPIGTILIAMYGQGKTRGQVAILNAPAATNQACAAIIPDYDICDKDYLFTYLKMSYEKIRGMARGGTQSNLNLNLVKSIRLPLPPLPLQHAFAAKVRALERQKQLVNDSIRELQTLLDSRMQEYFG